SLAPPRVSLPRPIRTIAVDRDAVARLVRPMQSARAVARRDHTLADHAQNADLSADRLHRRGRDDVVTGMDRRCAQLGLPLLLDSGCDVHALRAVEDRKSTRLNS